MQKLVSSQNYEEFVRILDNHIRKDFIIVPGTFYAHSHEYSIGFQKVNNTTYFAVVQEKSDGFVYISKEIADEI